MLISSHIREVNTVDQGIARNSIDIIKKALEDGDTIVNNEDHIKKTSLGKAIEHDCSIELINFLLKNGAEIKSEYKINNSPSGVVIHEYNHLHLAILYRRTNIVQMLLKQGAKTIKDIPFLDIISSLGKNTIFYDIYSFIEDNKGNTVYAESELLSHGILTTLNIAFGTHNPKLIQLILQHDRVSFIDNIEDNGMIPHPEFDSQGRLSEYFSYHPYHCRYLGKRLNYTNFLHHMDDLNNMNIDYLDHRSSTISKRIPGERIGLLKRYIDTPSRIAHMIILYILQSSNTIDQNKINDIEMIEFMTKCINSHKLELKGIIKPIKTLLKDGIVNVSDHDIQHPKRLRGEGIENKVLHYTEEIFNCAKKMFDSMKILNQEAKKIQEIISTSLIDVDIKNISVQADIWIGQYR